MTARCQRIIDEQSSFCNFLSTGLLSASVVNFSFNDLFSLSFNPPRCLLVYERVLLQSKTYTNWLREMKKKSNLIKCWHSRSKSKILRDLKFIVIEPWNELFDDSFNVLMLCHLRFEKQQREENSSRLLMTLKAFDKLNRCTSCVP